MNDIEAAAFRSELYKLAAEIGIKLEGCKRTNQISAGCHLVIARDEIFLALKSFNPKIDESQLNLLS